MPAWLGPIAGPPVSPCVEALIDYRAILKHAGINELASLIAYLSEELPYSWGDAYLSMTPRPTRIDRIRLGAFEYIYDDLASLEARADVPLSSTAEARLVGVLGTSAPRPRKRSRDDARLRGFIGRTNAQFGPAWDKGHYIGHEVGGSVDGTEVNVFIQRRALNRGWSPEGKVYRAMERYCRFHPGTFCFSRPFYADDTSKPSFVELGVLRAADDLWVEIFDNRGSTARDEMSTQVADAIGGLADGEAALIELPTKQERDRE